MDKDKHKHDEKGVFSALSSRLCRGGSAHHACPSRVYRRPLGGNRWPGDLVASHSGLSSHPYRQVSARPAYLPGACYRPRYLGAFPSGSEGYDHMQLVLQWQPAVCSVPNKRACVKLPDQSLTIHSFRPGTFSGAYVENRGQGDAFQRNEVDGIQPELDKCWPNMLGHDNYEFWRYQWEKHGRYSLNEFISNQSEYFNIAVKLANRCRGPIGDLLRAEISASNSLPTTTVKTSDIESRVHNKFGTYPALGCSPHRDRHRKVQLKEVILCFDKNGKDPIDCPVNQKRNKCPADILLSM